MIGTNAGRQVGSLVLGGQAVSHVSSPTGLAIGSRWMKGDGEASLFSNVYRSAKHFFSF